MRPFAGNPVREVAATGRRRTPFATMRFVSPVSPRERARVTREAERPLSMLT
jgi:hypothetical protein